MTTTSSVQVIAPQTLDTMTFPLHGARLIEASTGTGKTFTIAGLYLRLLFGHGTAAPQGALTEATRHHEPLTVDQILPIPPRPQQIFIVISTLVIRCNVVLLVCCLA